MLKHPIFLSLLLADELFLSSASVIDKLTLSVKCTIFVLLRRYREDGHRNRGKNAKKYVFPYMLSQQFEKSYT